MSSMAFYSCKKIIIIITMALLEHFFNEEAVEVTSFLSASKVGRFNVVVIAK